jgi:hypothetical protein
MNGARPRSPSEISDATMRLVLARGVGSAVLASLRGHLGRDESIVAAGDRALAGVPGLGPVTGPALRRAIRETDPDAER